MKTPCWASRGILGGSVLGLVVLVGAGGCASEGTTDRIGARTLDDILKAGTIRIGLNPITQLHSLLYGSTEWRDIGDWKTLAENAGVADLASYESCLMGEAAGRRLEEDMRLGDALGVTATPTFFYQFGGHVGYANEEQLLELIERSR